ncbi:MAG: ABC transporter substrate-binding protein [Prevotella sp.]|nr:ABC transporter substrate-binding protein [Prevotella sp.]
MCNKLYILIALFLTGILFACRERRGNLSSDTPAKPDDSCLVAVDASVYRGLMEMLGIGDRCIDFSDEGKIDAERLVASGAKILMLSVYDGIDTEKYRRTGVKVIECTDFNESTALRRAYRMVGYGAALGVKDRADSLYRIVEARYDSLRRSVAADGARPVVMFDLVYGNVWYQPGNDSSTGGIVADAGGNLLFPAGGKNGITALTKERMLMKSDAADVWIIRYSAAKQLSLAALGGQNPAYKQFKAFREGNVWACNTSRTAYFDEAPFRPDYLLEDIIHILHPQQDKDYQMRYFEKLQ